MKTEISYKIKKLSLHNCAFGLDECDVIMTSFGLQKLVFLLRAQNQVIETLVNDSFLWRPSETILTTKTDKSVT